MKIDRIRGKKCTKKKWWEERIYVYSTDTTNIKSGMELRPLLLQAFVHRM